MNRFAVAACPVTARVCSAKWFWLAGVVVLVLDQISKVAALNLLAGKVVPVLPFFNVRLAFNRGVSFSFLADVSFGHLPWLLAGVAVLMAIGFAWMAHGSGSGRLYQLALGCVAGGAVGNAVDRVLYGAVVDFLDFYYQTAHFPTFNIADTMINVGVALLVLDMFLQWKNKKETKNA